jgi:carbon monoxide dehydrogenase subunit G
MVINDAFTVSAPPDAVAAALADLARSVPCFHGARVDRHEGQAVEGQVRLPLGRVSVTYRGWLELVGYDRAERALSYRFEGREVRGGGVAAGEVMIRLREVAGTTVATVRTKGKVTGRAAILNDSVVRRAAAAMLTRFGSELVVPPQESRPRRRTLAARQGDRRPAVDRRRVARTAGDVPSASPSAEPARQRRVVPGRIQLVTPVPVRLGRNGQPQGSALARRPWVMPAALMTVLAAILVLRRRR